MAKQDPAGLISFEARLTVADGVNGVHLRNLEKVLGLSNVVKLISYLLLRLASNFNISNNLDENQAALLALDLYQKFEYESLEDVVLMLKMVRQGAIGGKLYHSFDVTTLNGWIPEYLELKAIERENQHNRPRNDYQPVPVAIGKAITETSGQEIKTEGRGLGTRKREELSTSNTPIQSRESYLKAVTYAATKTSNKELTWCVENSEDADVAQIAQKELETRGVQV